MKIYFRVFTSDPKFWQTFSFDTKAAPAEELLSNFVYHLKDEFPGNEFQCIKISRKRYNIIPIEVALPSHLVRPSLNA